MNHATHNALVSFIWNIADDVLRDVYTRSKYRDAILPLTVLRRLDSLLEPTGFDQPLLHTMYVDKALSDVKAVQTLSRLNRAYPPYKTETFVLDFVNTAEAIREAFDPFYKTTILSEATDLNRLNDLQDALDALQVYSTEQVTQFITLFLDGADRDQLDPILDACAAVYKADLDEDKQIAFKSGAKSFVRAYQFLASILPFKNAYWESLNTFLRFLLTKLPAPNDADLSQGILDSIDMDSYRAEQKATFAIQLTGGEELLPAPPDTGGSKREAELDKLSHILQTFNDRFGTDWTENDQIKRFLFEDLPDAVSKDEEYQNAKQHSDRQNARITHDKKVADKFQEIIFDHTDVYRKFTDDLEFKKWLCDTLFNLDYDSQPPPPSGA